MRHTLRNERTRTADGAREPSACIERKCAKPAGLGDTHSIAVAHSCARPVQLASEPAATVERGVLVACRERGEVIASGVARQMHHGAVFVLELGRAHDVARPPRATQALRAQLASTSHDARREAAPLQPACGERRGLARRRMCVTRQREPAVLTTSAAKPRPRVRGIARHSERPQVTCKVREHRFRGCNAASNEQARPQQAAARRRRCSRTHPFVDWANIGGAG